MTLGMRDIYQSQGELRNFEGEQVLEQENIVRCMFLIIYHHQKRTE